VRVRLIGFLDPVRAAFLFVPTCLPSNSGPSGPVSELGANNEVISESEGSEI
jgi:hypothetical protein